MSRQFRKRSYVLPGAHASKPVIGFEPAEKKYNVLQIESGHIRGITRWKYRQKDNPPMNLSL
jgi:hypothetical protein